MERLVSLESVLNGTVTYEHLIKLNALIDARDYQQASDHAEG